LPTIINWARAIDPAPTRNSNAAATQPAFANARIVSSPDIPCRYRHRGGIVTALAGGGKLAATVSVQPARLTAAQIG
jgi:hypothetical protein